MFVVCSRLSSVCGYAGRVNGAVTFPVPVSQQLAAGLQSGPFASLLGAAGIRYQLLWILLPVLVLVTNLFDQCC